MFNTSEMETFLRIVLWAWVALFLEMIAVLKGWWPGVGRVSGDGHGLALTSGLKQVAEGR